MQITQALHSAILISNLEKSQHFYSSILGLQKIDRVLKFPGIWYQIGNCQLHLILAATIIPDAVNNDKWGRNRHLAFSVANLEAAKQQLIAHNCPHCRTKNNFLCGIYNRSNSRHNHQLYWQ